MPYIFTANFQTLEHLTEEIQMATVPSLCPHLVIFVPILTTIFLVPVVVWTARFLVDVQLLSHPLRIAARLRLCAAGIPLLLALIL